MPRKLHNALTPIAVRNAGIGRHADGGGLYLRVQGGGARSWLFRAVVAGKARDVGLGPASGAGALSLAQARDRVKEALAQVAKGEIVEGKRATTRKAHSDALALAAKNKTFRETAEALIERKEGRWKNAKHRQQWRNTLVTYVYPTIGTLSCAAVETSHVLAILEPIWNPKPETASRVRGRIENILDAAKVQGLRAGENPARWRGHLDHILPAQSKLARGHHPSLDYSELAAFMANLRGREALAARMLEFTILTAARSGEVIGATWAEIDLATGLWTVPAVRMKAGKEHTVPLTARAIEILRNVQPLNTSDRDEKPIFPNHSGGSLSGMAMAMLIRRMNKTEQAAGRSGWLDRKQDDREVSPHGFRSTFRDWAGEQTSFPREVIEHALAHQLADKAEAAYQRKTLLPKRTKLMNAWADFYGLPVTASKHSNVSSIRLASSR